MITFSPIPLWYRLNNVSRMALTFYQRETYGLELEIPAYFDKASIIQPVRLSTEEAGREMRRPPSHQARVK